MSTPEVENLIREGERLLEAGENGQALPLFVQATLADPQNEQAWLGRAHATEEPAEALQSFEHVLEINPNNTRAREELTYLQVSKWRTATTAEQDVTQGKTRMPPRRLLLYVLVAVLILVLAGVGYGFYSGGITLPAVFTIPTRTEEPTVAALVLPPTWTPTSLPTATRTPASTNTPAPTATLIVTAVTGRVQDSANVRAGPGTYYALLGALARDKTITLIGKSADGQYYQFQDPEGGLQGWVFAGLVNVTGGDAKSLAVVSNPPYTPIPTRVVVAPPPPTLAPAPFQFKVSKELGAPNCGSWSLSGTTWSQGGEGLGPGNTRTGVRIRVVANGQTTFLVSGSGSFAGTSPGYWRMSFGNANTAIGGNVTVVDYGGYAISPSASYQLTASCSNDSDVNQMTIDFESIPF